MPIFNRDRHDPWLDEAAPRRIRLLVVDENPTALEVIGRRLSHAGHDVILARGSAAAMALLLSHRFDAILMECDMPAEGGIAAMRKMRSGLVDPGMPIMLITPRSDSAALAQALEAGADEQISRPFDFDMLDLRLRHMVDHRRQLQLAERENQALDARIARRAVELGEARDRIADLQADRQRLVASIQSLHDEIERLNSRDH